jgi:N-methylhydantoinase A
VLSAFGAATTDVRRERVRAVLATMPVDVDLVQKLMGELATGADDDLAADGVAPADRGVQFEADLRFAKQIFELSIPVTGPRFDEAARDRLLDDFRGEYAKRYGKGSIVLGAPVELVSLRAIGIGQTVHATLDGHAAGVVPEGTPAPVAGRRSVRVARTELVEVVVHSGAELRAGHALTGPALVDGSDTTMWVPAGASAQVDAHGTLIVEVGQ